MRIKFSPALIFGAAAVVIMVTAVYLLSGYIFPHAGPALILPANVTYALEYFNAVNSNKTILVPSAYYDLAKALAINGNKVVQNNTEYAGILLENKTYPNINFVLIDMEQLDGLKSLYADIGRTLDYNVTVFPSTYHIGNLSNSERNCLIYGNRSDMFAQCDLYFISVKVGSAAFAVFPGNPTIYEVNRSVFYNASAPSYSMDVSTARANSSAKKQGTVFVYEGLITLYLPKSLMSTFYGTEMFMPAFALNNVFDNFGEARIISLS